MANFKKNKKAFLFFTLLFTTAFLLLPARSFAVSFGTGESSEIYINPQSGWQDNRGKTRYDRLVEIFADWEQAGADFGVLCGDNIANDLTHWPTLQQALNTSSIPIYLVLGNHDWVDQDTSSPNFDYLQEYLQSTFGFDKPWYCFEQDGVLFVFLADDWLEKSTPEYPYQGGESDIHDEQFYWFKVLVNNNKEKPIIVFAHHPVFKSERVILINKCT